MRPLWLGLGWRNAAKASEISWTWGGRTVSGQVIQMTPELRERIERGLLRAGAVRFPGRTLVVEWKDADALGQVSSPGRDHCGDANAA